MGGPKKANGGVLGGLQNSHASNIRCSSCQLDPTKLLSSRAVSPHSASLFIFEFVYSYNNSLFEFVYGYNNFIFEFVYSYNNFIFKFVYSYGNIFEFVYSYNNSLFKFVYGYGGRGSNFDYNYGGLGFEFGDGFTLKGISNCYGL